MRSIIFVFALIAAVMVGADKGHGQPQPAPPQTTTARSRPSEWKQYDPILTIGSPKGWKNVLLVIWSHTSPQSAWAFRDILRNLNKEIQNNELTILMLQIAGPDQASIEQASVFLCVPKRNYGQVVIRYLDLLGKEKAPITTEKIDSLIAKASSGLGLPKTKSECWTGQLGFERKTALDAFRGASRKNWNTDTVPVFILNGRSVDVHSIADLRDRLLRDAK